MRYNQIEKQFINQIQLGGLLCIDYLNYLELSGLMP